MDKALLDKVAEDRLTKALDPNISDEERKAALKDGMEVVDRQIQLEKIEDAKKEQNKNRIIKVVEIAAIPTVMFVADFAMKRYFMRQICNFEKDYTFTTTPGRGVAGLFRFRK